MNRDKSHAVDACSLAGLVLVGCLVVGCIDQGVKPDPTPPQPVDHIEAVLLSVAVAYAEGCGDSLVETQAGPEAEYHAALKAARGRARVAAHGGEDDLLAEAAGDPAKVKAIGAAWKRVAEKLRGVK